jgi:hypothetical protein
MNPQRWFEAKLDPESHADDERAQNHDDADRPGVAGVGTPEVQPANRACGLQSQ